MHTGIWLGKKPLGKSSRRWDDGVKLDLQKTEWESVNCIHLRTKSSSWLL